MKKNLIFIIGMLYFLCCMGQDTKNDKLIEEFIISLSKDEPLDQVMEKYIMLSDSLSLKKKNYIESQLLSVKRKIIEFGLENISVKKLQDLSMFSKTRAPMEHVYSLSNSRGDFNYLWVENNKIKSFSTMRKGSNLRWFITY